MRHYVGQFRLTLDAILNGASAQRMALASIFTLTMFLSATLLFVVQPLFARMILPLLGGSPAVWNTTQVFYQVALLFGYLYAHLSRSWLKPRAQILLHAGLLLVPLLVLPIAVPGGWEPPSESNPIPWLLGALAAIVGLPFFVVATSSPLLQSWFARTDHPAAHDPYFLYAASNIGSMLGLLAYPFLIEPHLRLAEQSWFWMAGYLMLVALVLVCGALTWRSAAHTPQPTPISSINSVNQLTPITTTRRLRWMALAAVPSSLMLSVTAYLSSNISPFPLLWVIPLALYLLTYVLVFAARPPISHRLMQRVLPFVLTPLVICLIAGISEPIWLLFPLNLLVFFVATMVCHGELAIDRPPARQLTEFYLWMSFGGAVGGMLTALVAPLVFDRILEYPIALVILVLLQWRPNKDVLKDLTIGSSIFALSIVIVLGCALADIQDSGLLFALVIGVPGAMTLVLWHRPLRYATALIGLLAIGFYTQFSSHEMFTERSFFGINRVNAQGTMMTLVHGTTIHGMQNTDPARRREPLLYYHQNGPLGQFFAGWSRPGSGQRVAVVGLGVGATACYALPDQQWTMYEIDPVIEQIARDERFFTYLRDCTPTAPVILGDARLRLADAPDAAYDLIILDAYSSDAIPTHLMTKEALAIYRAKLAPQGILMFHITNRYLNLQPVLARLASDAGMTGLYQSYHVTETQLSQGKTATIWAAIARDTSDFGPLVGDERWEPLGDGAGTPLWTDDFQSVLDALRH